MKNDYKDDSVQVLEYLNAKTGRNYRAVDTNLKPIISLMKTGIKIEDFKAVITVKSRKWGSDPKMSEYLRPKTLFNKTNFENYFGELGVE